MNIHQLGGILSRWLVGVVGVRSGKLNASIAFPKKGSWKTLEADSGACALTSCTFVVFGFRCWVVSCDHDIQP